MVTVITTINKPNGAISEWAKKSKVIVIGDEKTPQGWNHENCDYYDLSRQYKLPFDIIRHLRMNHYCRKNIGYLLAMNDDKILDTDDDNFPNDNWKERKLNIRVSHTCDQKWCNIYQSLTPGTIWPRGFPLKLIKQATILEEINEEKICPIQQGLSDVSPDVDAIWRLMNNRDVYFWVKKSM